MVALVTLDWMMAARLRCLKMGPFPGQRFGQKEPSLNLRRWFDFIVSSARP
jgi:hypothetical protein